MSDKKLLVNFHIDCGRMGELDGLFVTTQDALNAAYGKTFYMGDVLGKHSEISEELDPSHITVLDADDDFIEKFTAIVGRDIGVNPLDYIEETEE